VAAAYWEMTVIEVLVIAIVDVGRNGNIKL
jgi:hypothetical protein